MSNFYFIIEEIPNSAFSNMAIDEALFNYVQKNKGASILRFYRWEKPSLSIGYHQKVKDVANIEFLNERGIDLVRRITGGKAVLHDDEITYSFSSSNPLLVKERNLLDSFYMLSSALIKGLKNLNISAHLSSRKHEDFYKTNLPCFSYPTGNEIVVNGRKLIGSAQKRGRDSLLQHGSIPITIDINTLARATFSSPENINGKIITLQELVGKVDFFKISLTLKEGFSEYFDCNFEPFDREKIKDEAERIKEEKYSNPSWNFDDR